MTLWKKDKAAEDSGPRKSPATRRSESLDAVRLREPVPRPPLARAHYYLQFIPKHLGTIAGAMVLMTFSAVLWQFLYHSSYFHIRNWEVIGCERLKEQQILALLAEDWENTEEISLPQYNVRAAEQRLISVPVVYHAFVTKHYPDGVQVVLQERRERALLVAANANFLVDIEGVLLARSRSSDLLNEKLSILTHDANYEEGDRLPNEFVDLAFVYADCIDTVNSELTGQLSEIQWSDENGMSLYLRSGTRLICGKLPPHETLPRAAALARKLGGFDDVDYADLRLPQDLPWRPFKADREIVRASR